MHRDGGGGYLQGRVGVSSRSWGALSGGAVLPGQSEHHRRQFRVTAWSWGQSMGYPAEGPGNSRKKHLGRIVSRTPLKTPPCLQGGTQGAGDCGVCQPSRQRVGGGGLEGTGLECRHKGQVGLHENMGSLGGRQARPLPGQLRHFSCYSWS